MERLFLMIKKIEKLGGGGGGGGGGERERERENWFPLLFINNKKASLNLA